MRRSGLPLLVVVVVVLAAVGVLNDRGVATNPVGTTIAAAPSAQSSALYCTGLTNTRGGLRGVVTYINTTAVTRHVVVHAFATGATSAVATAFTLGPYARQSVAPTNLLVGSTYALSAQIDGGGVSAAQVDSRFGTQSPCANQGVTNWYASGFDSTVGSSAVLSVYNPTATAAVFNVTAFTPGGFSSPASLQGVSVGPHAVLTFNLGAQIVATENFGVQVSVLRGSLVAVGDQISKGVASFNAGTTLLTSSATLPLVTTANQAMAQVRFANPGPAPATVTLDVKLGKFKVAPQTTEVGAYRSAMIVITPNTAIPAAGEATIVMKSTQPVDATVVTGTQDGLTSSPVGTPAARVVLADVTGGGFDRAVVTNVASTATEVSWVLRRRGALASTGTTSLGANATKSLAVLVGGRAKLTGATMVLTGLAPTLVVSATLVTRPPGVTLTTGLNGG